MRIRINNQIYRNPLFIAAMEVECGDDFRDFDVIFTGIGKVNAAYALTKGIFQRKPDLIVNIGTAGSLFFNVGDIVCCTSFVQRDMDATALGFPKFKTPFSSDPVVLKHGLKLANFTEGICGSGDHFESDGSGDDYSVVDMEAYALAKVCSEEKLPFLCLKYISDGADSNALTDWNTEVKKASQKLHDAISVFTE